jgi:hypothetical protein
MPTALSIVRLQLHFLTEFALPHPRARLRVARLFSAHRIAAVTSRCRSGFGQIQTRPRPAQWPTPLTDLGRSRPMRWPPTHITNTFDVGAVDWGCRPICVGPITAPRGQGCKPYRLSLEPVDVAFDAAMQTLGRTRRGAKPHLCRLWQAIGGSNKRWGLALRAREHPEGALPWPRRRIVSRRMRQRP